jgi:hypothetical protein
MRWSPRRMRQARTVRSKHRGAWLLVFVAWALTNWLMWMLNDIRPFVLLGLVGGAASLFMLTRRCPRCREFALAYRVTRGAWAFRLWGLRYWPKRCSGCGFSFE